MYDSRHFKSDPEIGTSTCLVILMHLREKGIHDLNSITMTTIEIFNTHVAEYEEWFNQYPFVFQSEIEAIREMLPTGEKLSGIEIGLGTGRYAQALQIKEGIEPAQNMRSLAIRRGIETMNATADSLPFGD